MKIIHFIAAAAFIFGCAISQAAQHSGASVFVVIAWPVGIVLATYVVSVVVICVAGGGTFQDLARVFLALFLPAKATESAEHGAQQGASSDPRKKRAGG